MSYLLTKQKSVDKLKIQESEILLILYELRTRVLKSDLDTKYKEPIAKQLDDSAEVIKDQFAMEYYKLKNVGRLPNLTLEDEKRIKERLQNAPADGNVKFSSSVDDISSNSS